MNNDDDAHGDDDADDGRLCVRNEFGTRLKIEGHFWHDCHSS